MGFQCEKKSKDRYLNIGFIKILAEWTYLCIISEKVGNCLNQLRVCEIMCYDWKLYNGLKK